jgi:fumarate hydratase subunit beta
MKKLVLPLTRSNIADLKTGDEVLISGVIYTARDAAHQRLCNLIKAKQKLPVELKNQIIYYAGPTPAPKGKPIGSIGPTTSDRMDPFTPLLLANGLKGIIGKGPRSQEVKSALRKNRAVYFGAIGGAGALLAQAVKKAKVVAFAELGTEAIHELFVEDFPAVVLNDIYGHDLYSQR